MSIILKWLPRLIGIGAVLFIGAFALDVFSEPGELNPGDLFMHLLPALVLTVLVAIAWKWKTLGGLLLIAIAITPFFLVPSNTPEVNAMLGAPAFIAGLLFVLDGLRRPGAPRPA